MSHTTQVRQGLEVELLPHTFTRLLIIHTQIHWTLAECQWLQVIPDTLRRALGRQASDSMTTAENEDDAQTLTVGGYSKT